MSPASASPPGVSRVVRRALGSHVLVLLVLALVTTFLLLQANRLLGEARDARARVVQASALRGDILLAQSSLRGVVLGGVPGLLDDYNRAWERVAVGFPQLLDDEVDGRSRTLLDEAETTMHQVHDRYGTPEIAAVRRGDAPAAVRLFRTGGGARGTARVITLVSRAEGIERSAAEQADDRVDRLGLVLAIAIVATSLLAALSALLFMRSLARDLGDPLHRLAEAADSVGSGDLSARAPVEGVWETEVVARAFNDMAERVEHEVAALREVDELKDTFVSSVSHELRTPLTSIRGYLEALLEDEAGALNSEQRRYAEIAFRNAGRLDSLISDLLALSRLESGRAALERRAVPLSDVLRDLRDELRPAAEAKQIDVRLDVPDGMRIVADPMRIQQTFGNLLSNAIKFSHPGDTVVLKASADGDDICVEVVDRGVGIPEDELARIGQRFFRSRDHVGVEGTGLGLAISREIVEQHGGRLEVESVRGEGSTFRVRLPARRQGEGVADTLSG